MSYPELVCSIERITLRRSFWQKCREAILGKKDPKFDRFLLLGATGGHQHWLDITFYRDGSLRIRPVTWPPVPECDRKRIELDEKQKVKLLPLWEHEQVAWRVANAVYHTLEDAGVRP